MAAFRSRNIQSNADLVAAYERALDSYRMTFDDKTPNTVLERLRLAEPKLPSLNTESSELRRLVKNWMKLREELLEKDLKRIGSVSEVSGEVRIERTDGSRVRAIEGTQIWIGDVIITNASSIVRIAMLDRDPRDESRSEFDIGTDSQVTVAKWMLQIDDDETHRYGLLELIRGAVRSVSQSWGSGSLFSVRAGTTVAGIRGTDLAVRYRPEQDEVFYRLREGVVEIQTANGQKMTLRAGQTLTVTAGRLGKLGTLDMKPPS